MKNQQTLRKWVGVSLFNFFVAAIMGLLLRLHQSGVDIGFNYSFLIHAHSHTAMMGWVYMAIYSLIYALFLDENKKIEKLFWITEITVIGIMVTFIWQGYGLYSITFAVLHLFCSYYFAYLAIKLLKNKKDQGSQLIRASLYFLVISTLGLWAVGPTIGMAGRGSDPFQVSLQFYLHFQFNGFFLFAVLGGILKYFNLKIKEDNFKEFYNLLLISVVLTYALPVSWYYPSTVTYLIHLAGAILQLIALLVVYEKSWTEKLNQLRNIRGVLVFFAAFSIFMKMTLPLLLAYPPIMKYSHEIRNLTIGYIHMVMLGGVSSIMIFIMTGLVSYKKPIFIIGLVCFVTGFIFTEGLLFIQGIQVLTGRLLFGNFYQLLVLFSILLPIAVMLWWISLRKTYSKIQ